MLDWPVICLLNLLSDNVSFLATVESIVLKLTPEHVNELQFAFHQSSVVEDIASFIQMFSQIRDENALDPVMIASKPQPNVDARVKFDGLVVSATASAGSTLLFNTRTFEFKINSVGAAGEEIFIKADLDPVFVFGNMPGSSTMDVIRNPELSCFDLHTSLTFDKSSSCAQHDAIQNDCERCAKAAQGYAFVVKIKNPSLYLPPEAIQSAMQFA